MKSFALTMKEVFQKSGQTSSDFMAEYKNLSPIDRLWYFQELAKAGFECDPPFTPPA